MRLQALVAAALVALSATAQRPSKLNLQLENYLARPHAAGAELDLFVRGEEQGIAAAVKEQGGRVKLVMDGLVSASVPVDRVRDLAASPAVTGFEFSLSKGHALNDSMRVKARVEQVHAGLAPLPSGYDGEGVLVGIIDSGIDLGHPDFRDSLGNTRVLKYWDQTFPNDAQLTPQPYDYGQAWDSAAINAGNCPAVDQPQWYGHGTTVAGTAVGNGRATGFFTGVAPASDIIAVSSDFNRANWKASVVDAVRYILDEAAAQGRPVVINASLGDYYGSHDGLDAAALLIDSMITAASGRALVCAAGNSYTLPSYHLHTDVTPDSAFTWFQQQPASINNLGVDAVFFEVWADTAEFNDVEYAVGVDRTIANIWDFRGRTPFYRAQDHLGVVLTDSVVSFDGNLLGVVQTRAELRGAQYHLEVVSVEPDSSQFYFRFMTTGNGSFDVWSSYFLGSSPIVSTDLPSPVQFPDIAKYVLPDNDQRMVDSWACLESTITVANYQNETNYIDYNGAPQSVSGQEDNIAVSSSNGPTRDGRMKPDLAAPGDITLTAGPASFISLLLANNGAFKIAPGGYHMRAGGTSIASPVVAGSVALYLQKCPTAMAEDIVRSFELASFEDQWTGMVPNNRWGHGKVNTYEALVGRREVPVTFSPSPVICPGDSVLAQGPTGMAAYTWSNGGDAASTWFAQQAVVNLTVTTPSGCQAWSYDYGVIEDAPIPTPTITQVGYTLESSPAAGYQWFYNGGAIPGATDQTLDVWDSGDYFVQVSNANGCTANSDTLFVLSTGVAEVAGEGLAVWPVPAEQEVMVQLPAGLGDQAWMQLVDAQGRIVLRQRASGAQERLSLHGLATGMYRLRVTDGTASWTTALQVR
ncbi:MAG: S8 family peptidase [Flavobacteriales bacterium]|nr:S8 family peptidase [Flavobacteriales bacterium]